MSPPFDYSSLERGRHCNYYSHDRALQYELQRRCSTAELEWGESKLHAFGSMIGDTVVDNADVVADNPPELKSFDRHGDRINEISYHPAHRENERLVYEAGLIADAYNAPPGRDESVSFPYHFGQFYLMEYASSVGLGCPAAMTSGVALLLDRYDDGTLRHVYDAVTAREYDEMATGAMFLTERQGGSDVGVNELTARSRSDGLFELWGEKWFCSNVAAGAPLALARRPEAPEGTAGLSLFLVAPEEDDTAAPTYQIRRLKDKLGTKSVPTGEIVFEGTPAHLLGEPEQGFALMAEMLNAERLYNAISSCASIGRSLLESKVHAANRRAFGARLDEHPLMRRDLLEMVTDHEAALVFTFEAIDAFHRTVRADDDRAHQLMRLLVPVAKYRTARMAVDCASYAMEIKGGNGYVEEFVHPRLLRNAQVLPIWEGPSNIMALDVLRSMGRHAAHEPLLERIDDCLESVEHPSLHPVVRIVADERDALESKLQTAATNDPEETQWYAKTITDCCFDVTTAALLLERAQWQIDDCTDGRNALVARRFVNAAFERDDHDLAGPPSAEEFSAIVRHGKYAPEQLTETSNSG